MNLLRAVLCGWFLALPVIGGPPLGYYAAADGKSGYELRAALHQTIRGHTVIPYSSSDGIDTSDALKVLDRDPSNSNNVILIYSGATAAVTAFGTTEGWNREHLWPNSYGLDDREPAFSDLHNLRAVDATVNSTRGNKFYDFSQTNSPSFRLPATPEALLCSTDSDSWEPPNFQKGDIARAIFYMDVRYDGDAPNEPELIITDATAFVLSTTNFMGRLSTLLRWHLNDPVDGREMLRNDLVFRLYQGNRNPFVDHPEWVESVFGDSTLRLSANRAGSNLQLTWSAAFVNATLESKSVLSDLWFPIAVQTRTTNGQWTAVIPMPGRSSFFRLRLN